MRTGGADQRNAPHLLGLGPVAALAVEMTADLRREASEAMAQARADGQPVERELTSKGVSFGRLVANPDGTEDGSGITGVDRDLTVRPFGWKGHQATLRGMVEESLHIHQGLISKRIHLAVRDGNLDPAPFGTGKWDDLDGDGVSLEIDSGMLTTVVGYLAQLEAPVMRRRRIPGCSTCSRGDVRASRRSAARPAMCRRSRAERPAARRPPAAAGRTVRRSS